MATRSAVLANGSFAGRPSTIVYTCPPSAVTLVKSAYYLNGASSESDVILQLVSNVKGAGPRLHFFQMPSGGLAEWQGWTVLEPDDQLSLYISAGPVFYWISGAILPPRS